MFLYNEGEKRGSPMSSSKAFRALFFTYSSIFFPELIFSYVVWDERSYFFHMDSKCPQHHQLDRTTSVLYQVSAYVWASFWLLILCPWPVCLSQALGQAATFITALSPLLTAEQVLFFCFFGYSRTSSFWYEFFKKLSSSKRHLLKFWDLYPQLYHIVSSFNMPGAPLHIFRSSLMYQNKVVTFFSSVQLCIYLLLGSLLGIWYFYCYLRGAECTSPKYVTLA